ncbi:unnamed protein product [Closterium sp. NIES-64]|nr:unnamed protein product [Closterium sp. NIES-64]
MLSVSPTVVLAVLMSGCIALSQPSNVHLVAMAAPGDLDDANAVAPQSPPRQQELDNEDAVWQRPLRIEADPVVRGYVETTKIATEAPESSNSVALKRPRYTQTTIGFGTGTPLVKPPPPPPPIVPPAPSPLKLTAAKRAEAKFLEAQRNYITKWLPQFDWLLLDKGEDGLPRLRCSVDITLVHQEVDRTIACIRHRFVEYDNGFGGGVSKLVSPFIARMASGNMKIKVDDVDMEGEPTLHEIELSEEPIKGHKFGRSMADYIKL